MLFSDCVQNQRVAKHFLTHVSYVSTAQGGTQLLSFYWTIRRPTTISIRFAVSSRRHEKKNLDINFSVSKNFKDSFCFQTCPCVQFNIFMTKTMTAEKELFIIHDFSEK